MVSRTRWFFVGFLTLLGLQRLLELRLSRRNERWILAQGGQEYVPGQWRLMRGMHTAWFAAMLLEVFTLKRPFRPALAGGASILFLTGQALRYAAIRALGPRWTVRVMTLPGAPPVEGGIYRQLRHPNYLGVALEILAVPLLHSAWWTAALFSLLNGLLLRARIHAEEQALDRHNQYLALFRDRPRWVPRLKKEYPAKL